MTTHVNISDAERSVIEVLWANGALTAEQVARELASSNAWSFATIKTLLGRLLKKGAITAVADGRRFIYSAKLQKADYVAVESERFVDRLFAGRVAPLVSHFSDAKRLSKQDIRELRELLDKLPR